MGSDRQTHCRVLSRIFMGLFKPRGRQVQTFPAHERFLFQPWVLAVTEGKLGPFLTQLGLLRVSRRLNVGSSPSFLGMGHLLPSPFPSSPQFPPLSEVMSMHSNPPPPLKQCKPSFRKATWWFHLKFFFLVVGVETGKLPGTMENVTPNALGMLRG